MAKLLGNYIDDYGNVKKKTNRWSEVFDFTPAKDGSCNYTLSDPSQFKIIEFATIAEKYRIAPDLRFLVMNPYWGEGEFLYELPEEYAIALAEQEQSLTSEEQRREQASASHVSLTVEIEQVPQAPADSEPQEHMQI